MIEKEESLSSYPKVNEQLNLLKETIADDIEHLQSSKDHHAKVGHKTADSSFFGYVTMDMYSHVTESLEGRAWTP